MSYHDSYSALDTLRSCCSVFFLVSMVALVAVALERSVIRSSPSRHKAPPDPLDILRATDPGFTWESFCARALTVYEIVQRARMVRQPALAERFVTDDLLQGLTNAALGAGIRGVARTLVPVTVTGIGAVRTSNDGVVRSLTVRIVGTTTVAGSEALAGIDLDPVPGTDDLQATVDELWTFERSLAATTAAPVSLSRCPHCGGPWRDPHSPQCSYCGHSLRMSSDDWHASRIEPTQAITETGS